MTKQQGMGVEILTIKSKKCKDSWMPNIKWFQYKDVEIWRAVHVFFCINKLSLHEIVSEANALLSDLERESSLYREY